MPPPDRAGPPPEFAVPLAGRYQIERRLGEGGMAVVYLARDLRHDRPVAVKVVRPELAASLVADRFLREIEIAAQLNHPHILPLLDSGHAGELLFYVMPWIEAGTVGERLARETQLPLTDAVRVAAEVTEALAHAHARGIVHRDIKPANVMLAGRHALVADFGIARALGAGAAALTGTGLSVGTPQYMAPEQAAGDPNVDGRADVYAVGALLYEMISGEPPFTGATARAVITRSITEPPRPLAQSREGVPPALEAVVMKALAKSPADRHATAAELGADLERALDALRGGAAAPPPSAGARVSRGRAVTAGALVLGAAALVAAGVALYEPSGSAPATGVRLAVLPFDNRGADEHAYVVEGITDELRGRLMQVPGVDVIAQSSSEHYRDSPLTPGRIAEELGVNYLLTGTVRWVDAPSGGASIHVASELVDARSGTAEWRRRFVRGTDDLLGVQSAIATEVAGALGVELGAGVAARLAERPTESEAAYDSYLKARAMAGRDGPTRQAAASYYEQAVALDDEFVEAWAGLARSLVRVYFGGSYDAAVAERIRVAATRARALDPDGATGAGAMFDYHTLTGNRDSAAFYVDAAVAAAPGDAEILVLAGTHELETGRVDAALAKFRRAYDLAPRSQEVANWLLAGLNYAQRYDEARELGPRVTALGPEAVIPWQDRAISHAAAGDMDGVRGVVREALGHVAPTALVTHFAGYHETTWMLDDPQQELVFRLTPAMFDGNVAWWAQSLATAAWDRGERTAARRYADSALAPSREQALAAGDQPIPHVLYALMLAYGGRAADARVEIDAALAGLDLLGVRGSGYVLLQCARAELALGDEAAALDHIERLLGMPSFVSPAWMAVDPMFEPLRGNPRFERVAAR